MGRLNGRVAVVTGGTRGIGEAISVGLKKAGYKVEIATKTKGVDNVVATLWRIEDEGAAAFAAEFYRALVRGDPVEALAEAQRAMLGGGRYGAPFYWAGYRLDGRG